jgi:hypothetical protein
MYRNMLAAAAAALLAAGVLASAGAAEEKGKDPGFIKLFNGKDLTGWKKFVDPKSGADPDKIWTVKDGVIHCDGSVNGYIITEKEYENYVLRFQWRWGEKVTRGRNSGVFVHVSGEDKIWPKGVEAQLMAGRAGDFWLVGDFKLNVDKARQDPRVARHYFRTKDKVEKELGEWNQYEITCKGDTITVVINGQKVNEGSGAEATKGKILLQSEGAEVHFRAIELKPLEK